MVVHTKGGGSLLLALRYASIAAMRSGTEANTPRRMALSVISRNRRFLTEVLSPARGAGASGPLTLRADSLHPPMGPTNNTELRGLRPTRERAARRPGWADAHGGLRGLRSVAVRGP